MWECRGLSARGGWPLPTHLQSRLLGSVIHQDLGRGRLPSAHKCMEQALKLTLWQLFSHPFDGPVSAHLLQVLKKSEIMTQDGWAGGGAKLMAEYGVKAQ